MHMSELYHLLKKPHVLLVKPSLTMAAILTSYLPLDQKRLSLSVATTITTASVTFLYGDLANVRLFVAYVNRRGSSQNCSVSPQTSPLQCTLTGIGEATEFTVIAEVCLREKPACEPEVKQKTRTKLRGSFNCLLVLVYLARCLTVYVVF